MWSAEHILRNTRDQLGFPGGAVVKNPPADAEVARESGSIPGPIRSPGEGNGNPLQHSSIEIESSMDRGTWCATYSPWHLKKFRHDWGLSIHTWKQLDRKVCVLDRKVSEVTNQKN